MQILLAELVKVYGSKTAFIEIRNYKTLNGCNELYYSFNFQFLPYLNFWLDTQTGTEVWANINSGKKRQIEKSLTAGAIVTEAANIGEVRELYEILKELYLEKIGKPLPGLLFFEKFYTEIHQKKKGVILVVKNYNKVIGGAFCPVFNNKAIYEWYICGLDKIYRSLNIYPSVLATWGIIDFAIQHKIHSVEFMGAGKAGEAYGVRDFKARFGGTMIESGRYLRINKPLIYQAGKMGLKVLKMINKIKN